MEEPMGPPGDPRELSSSMALVMKDLFFITVYVASSSIALAASADTRPKIHEPSKWIRASPGTIGGAKATASVTGI